MERLDSEAEARPDADIVTEVVEGDVPAFAVLMRRYNRRLFRAVRAVVQDDAEAEDTCQDAWLRAYRGLADLQERSAFACWLTKIGLRCALERRAVARRVVPFEELDAHHCETPDIALQAHVEDRELVVRIERALDELPPTYRAIVLLRDLEHMTTTEVAEAIGLTEQNVRVRLHRARASLRQRLARELGADIEDVFRFDGQRCVRLTRAVLEHLS